jgi:transposase InsO family protein
VPASHAGVAKLPAVSGSSGRLVIEPPMASEPEGHWPGQLFADEQRDYREAMLAFVAASTPQPTPAAASDRLEVQTLKEQKRALHQQEAQLRTARRALRQRRRLEDAAWQALKREQARQATRSAASTPAERQAQAEHWRSLRRQRRETVAQRKVTDHAWRQQRLAFRHQWAQLPLVTAWFAILVITDNCSRQCLGLPLFVTGPKVTAEMIVAALQPLLPPELLFLISDRGLHFRAAAFQRLRRQEEFIQVFIARHRPQSNGIAERFVRSLKEWLRDNSWQDDRQLAALLDQFLTEYNDRPHQGLPIPGLSPNEFAHRIWLF